jgi:hypothetical protein
MPTGAVTVPGYLDAKGRRIPSGYIANDAEPVFEIIRSRFWDRLSIAHLGHQSFWSAPGAFGPWMYHRTDALLETDLLENAKLDLGPYVNSSAIRIYTFGWPIRWCSTSYMDHVTPIPQAFRRGESIVSATRNSSKTIASEILSNFPYPPDDLSVTRLVACAAALVAMLRMLFLVLQWIAARLRRGSLRLRKGCCHRCGYDLVGLTPAAAPCPECGTPRPKARKSLPPTPAGAG